MVKLAVVFVLAFLLCVCVSKVASSTTRESDEKPRVPSVGGEICWVFFARERESLMKTGSHVYPVLMVKLAVAVFGNSGKQRDR